MNILSNLFRKKFLSCRQGKRYISFKLRNSLCYQLTEVAINESGSTVFTVTGFKSANMSKCTKFEIAVISNGGLASSSVQVDMGVYSYLFNCGENGVRARSALKLKSSSVHGIFITSSYAHHFGGLLSTVLTQKDTFEETFLFGPPKLKAIITESQAQNFLKPLFLRIMTDHSTQIFDDGMVKVKLVPLYHESRGKSKSISESSAIVEDEYVLSYVCETEDFGFHLDIEACKRKNVPIGPLLKQLKMKKDITLDDGKVVHWKDVSYFSSNGPCRIIFADCPTAGYLDSLLNEKEFISLQSSGETPAALVVHFTPPQIMETEKYRKWMSLFSSSTEHLIVNEDNRGLGVMGLICQQKKFNYLCPSVFPSLLDEGEPVMNEKCPSDIERPNLYTSRDEEKKEGTKTGKLPSNFIPAREALTSMQDIYQDMDGINVVRAIPSLTKVVHPARPYEWHFNGSPHFSSVLDKFVGTEEIKSKLEHFKIFEKDWMSSDACLKRPEYPKILFLGTGSGEPARFRAPSGIILYLNPDEIVLFDCGEGTYQQMLVLFGPEKLKDVLKKIILIFVSHYHVDHHFGILTILSKRLSALNENGTVTGRRLVLMLPNEVKNWLKAMNEMHERILQNLIMFNNEQFSSVRAEIRKFLSDTEVGDINICYVAHFLRAWGVSITLKNGYKITYSGDTKPCDSLVNLGQGSNILIHESTFCDDLEKMALIKNHSTSSQAIETGIKMKAKYIILTHFSQRYYKCLPLDYRKIPNNVGLAFDFMIVNERVLPLITKLNSIYKIIFEDELAKVRKANEKDMREEKQLNSPDEKERMEKPRESGRKKGGKKADSEGPVQGNRKRKMQI